MYGLFLEDISYAGDGGLISELVNNGSFEYEANKTAYWNIDGSNVTTKIDGQSINIIRVYYGDNNGSSAYNLPDLPDNMLSEVTEFDSFVMTPELGFVVGIIGIAIFLTIVFVIIAIINKKLINKRAGINKKV